MAVNDYVLRVKPTAGQTAPRDEVSGVSFTGTGTPTLIDAGSEKAWEITFGTLLKKTGLSMALNGAIDGGGKTLAIRFRMNTTSSDSFMPMAGVAKSGGLLTEAFFAGQNGGNSYRGRINPSGTTIGSTSIASKPNGVIYTLVYKFVTRVASNSDEGKLWVNTVGRVGTAPDAVSGGASAFTATFTDAYINCQGTTGAYDLFDLLFWDGEKTDAECAQLADSLRETLDGGGTTPITFSGTIPNQTFTAGQSVSVNLATYFSGTQTPFTFAASGAALTGTGLSITSAGALTGTATAGSVTGVTITGTDASSNTAVSNAFNVTVNAPTPVSFSGTVPDQTGAVGTPYSLNLSTYFSGSLTPFTYFLVFGDLTGTGLSLNTSTGVISGTPTGAANLDLQVRATDTGTNTAVTNVFALDITAATPVSFTGTIPAISGTQNTAITPVNTSTYFSGSLTPFTYSLFSGTLPTGVTLNSSTGVISGTPTVSFTGNIVVRATDTGSNVVNSNSIAVNIAAATVDGTITLADLKNNTATPLASTSGFYVTILSATNPKSVVYNTASVSSNASAAITFTNAAIVQGTEYRYFIEKDGVAFAAGKVTAT